MSVTQIMFKLVKIKGGVKTSAFFAYSSLSPSFLKILYHHLSFAHLYAGGMDAAAAAFRDSEDIINMAGAPLTARAKEKRREREAGGRKE